MATFRGAIPIFVLGFLCILAFTLTGQSPKAAGSAGTFDYYLLSLSWAPEFCSQPNQAAANPKECDSGHSINFVVHGLWPQETNGRGPESCGGSKTVGRGIVNSLLPYMFSQGLIQHEWTTHGTCSGLTAEQYFTSVLRARAAVQIPVQLSSIGATDTESPALIEEQFAGSNPSLPKNAFRTACSRGALTEVRVCFDKDIKGRACTASAGECTTRSVTIMPLR